MVINGSIFYTISRGIFMKKILKIAPLFIIPFTLSSCAMVVELKKVMFYESTDEETFHEKAVESYKDVPYTSAVVNGKLTSKHKIAFKEIDIKKEKVHLKDGKVDYETTTTETEEQEVATELVDANATNFAFNEDYFRNEGYSVFSYYYLKKTGGFRIEYSFNYRNEDEKYPSGFVFIEFDKYAMLTSYSYNSLGSGKITVKYSK